MATWKSIMALVTENQTFKYLIFLPMITALSMENFYVLDSGHSHRNSSLFHFTTP